MRIFAGAMLVGLVLVVTVGCDAGGVPAVVTPIPTSTPIPTDTPRPTSTPRPTNTATVLPTATPEPPTATPEPPPPTDTVPAAPTEPILDAYDFSNRVLYNDSIGNLIVAGIVRYNGAEVRSNPDITLTFYNAEGQVLAVGKAYSVPNIMRPHSNVPYRIVIDNPPEKWERSAFEIQAQVADRFTLDFFTDQFEVSGTNLIPPSGRFDGLKLVGRVKNTGQKSATLVQIFGVVFDAEGKVLDVDSTFASLSTIEPGAESPFEVEFPHARAGTRTEVVVGGFHQ